MCSVESLVRRGDVSRRGAIQVGRVAVCVVTMANVCVVFVFQLGKAALTVCHLDKGAV